MRRAHHDHRAFAICAALLWLLGVEVLPNLHLAFHADDHTHDRDGTIVTLGHHQDGDEADHHHYPPLGDSPSKKRELAFDDAPSGHAAAGIAHRAAALHQPPPPLTAPLALPHVEGWRHAQPNARIASALRARPAARGPPA